MREREREAAAEREKGRVARVWRGERPGAHFIGRERWWRGMALGVVTATSSHLKKRVTATNGFGPVGRCRVKTGQGKER